MRRRWACELSRLSAMLDNHPLIGVAPVSLEYQQGPTRRIRGAHAVASGSCGCVGLMRLRRAHAVASGSCGCVGLMRLRRAHAVASGVAEVMASPVPALLLCVSRWYCDGLLSGDPSRLQPLRIFEFRVTARDVRCASATFVPELSWGPSAKSMRSAP